MAKSQTEDGTVCIAMRTLFFLLLLGGLSLSVVQAQIPDRGYFQATYQNDYFTATDYYFTQGIRLECAAPVFRFSPLAPFLLRFADEQPLVHRFFLQQDGYTPTSIRADSILYDDRPYAGALYLGQKTVSLRESQVLRLSSEIKLGVIGPWALAGEEQEYIHRQTGNVEPMGWQYQIENDLLLNYHLQLDQQLYHSRWLSAAGGAHLKIGTYRNRIGLRSKLKLGWVDNDFTYQTARSKSRFYLFGEGQISFIAYDASLQGGVFNKSSVYTLSARDIRRLVAQIEAGVAIRLGKLHLFFSHTHISKEFRTGRRHAWGTARIRMGF